MNSKLTVLVALVAFACSSQTERLAKVAPVSLDKLDPNVFSKDEWFIPYYLKNFEKVANSVLDTGTNRGYIDIMVWRTPDVNKPYNARIMENILSLAWFYTKDRPWNSYYADRALRERLELALTFWCDMQSPEGKFSEYDRDRWSLAPTAFAAKFIGRALYLLEEGPAIDPKVMARANESLRKALFVSFTDSAFWSHGRNFTNQYANLWGGAMMYLQHHRDPVIDQLLTNRINDSMEEFQSSCGYFYEKNGPDWGYNLSTHHSDLQVAWHYANGTRLRDYFIEKTAKWYDWFALNAVKEPNSARFYLNKSIETRQQRWFIDTDQLEDPASMRWTPQAEVVPVARAFVLSREELDSAEAGAYGAMQDRFPDVNEMKKGGFWSFSPYAFLHNELNRWLPTREQKKEAIADLPYLKSNYFSQVRSDRRNETQYSFLRRPKYYAILNTGKIITDQQRYGLGLVWNPKLGTVFQSQSRSDVGAWGTMAADSTRVFEAMDVNASFTVDGSIWNPAPGINEVDGAFMAQYALGPNGRKLISFKDEAIEVEVAMDGTFTEIIPLLVTDQEKVEIRGRKIVLEAVSGSMIIEVDSAAGIVIDPQEIDTDGGKRCRVVEIRGTNRLKYKIHFDENDL